MMDYRLEAVHEVMFAMWASRSRATRSFERGAQGEMFVLRELAFQGPRTPSQLAEAMGATSGRVSTAMNWSNGSNGCSRRWVNAVHATSWGCSANS